MVISFFEYILSINDIWRRLLSLLYNNVAHLSALVEILITGLVFFRLVVSIKVHLLFLVLLLKIFVKFVHLFDFAVLVFSPPLVV